MHNTDNEVCVPTGGAFWITDSDNSIVFQDFDRILPETAISSATTISSNSSKCFYAASVVSTCCHSAAGFGTTTGWQGLDTATTEGRCYASGFECCTALDAGTSTKGGTSSESITEPTSSKSADFKRVACAGEQANCAQFTSR